MCAASENERQSRLIRRTKGDVREIDATPYGNEFIEPRDAPAPPKNVDGGEAVPSTIPPESIPFLTRRDGTVLTPEQIHESAIKGHITYYLIYLGDADKLDKREKNDAIRHAAYELNKTREELGFSSFRQMAKYCGKPREKWFSRLDAMKKHRRIPKKPVFASGEMTPLEEKWVREDVSKYLGYIKESQDDTSKSEGLARKYYEYGAFMLKVTRDRLKLDSYAGLAKYSDGAEDKKLLAHLDRMDEASPEPKTMLARGTKPAAQGPEAQTKAAEEEVAQEPKITAKEKESLGWLAAKYAEVVRTNGQAYMEWDYQGREAAQRAVTENIEKAIGELERIRERLGAKSFSALSGYLSKYAPPNYTGIELDKQFLKMLDFARKKGDLMKSSFAVLNGWRSQRREEQEKKWLEDGIRFYAEQFSKYALLIRDALKPEERKVAYDAALRAAWNLEVIRGKLGLSGKQFSSHASLTSKQKKAVKTALDTWNASTIRRQEQAEVAQAPAPKAAPEEVAEEPLTKADIEWLLGGVKTYLDSFNNAKLRKGSSGASARNNAVWRLEHIRSRVGRELFDAELSKHLKNEKERKELVAQLDSVTSYRTPRQAAPMAAEATPTEAAPSPESEETMTFSEGEVTEFEKKQGKEGLMVERSAREEEQANEMKRRQFVSDTMMRLIEEGTSHYLGRTLEEDMKRYGFSSFAQMAEYTEDKAHKQFLQALGEINDVDRFLAEAKRKQPWKRQG